MEIDENTQLTRALWRELVKHRASYLCETCGADANDGRITAHHVNLDATDNRLANGQALCNSCHVTLHHTFWGKREISPEHRAKLNAAIRNRKLTPEDRAKLSAAQKEAWKHREVTPEFRAVMSANGKKNASHMHSPEAIAKRSRGQRGKTVSPETRAKISAARMGQKASPETRAKMSASHKARLAKR